MFYTIINKINNVKDDMLLGGFFVLSFLFEPLQKMMSNITYEIFSQFLTIVIQLLILITIILKLRHQLKSKKEK